MLTTLALILLAILGWTVLSLLGGIAVGQLLRRSEPPAVPVRHAPAPPRLVQPAA